MNEIVGINNTKKYIKLSTTLIQHIVSRKILSTTSACLWLQIYSKSYHLPSRKLCTAQNRMASDLGVTLRTIQRLLRELISTGFLLSVPLDQSDPYCINTYECIIPEWLQNECLNESDTDIELQSEIIQTQHKQNHEEKGDTERDIEHKEEPKLHINNEIQREVHDNHVDEKQTRHNCQASNQNTEPLKDEKKLSEDKNVVHKDINYLYINTQCMDCEYLQSECEKIEQELEKASEAFRVSPSFEAMSVRRKWESELMGAKMALKRAKKEAEEEVRNRKQQEVICEITNQLESNEKLLLTKQGKREIAPGLFWWVKKKLHSFAIPKARMAAVLNEIIFSVRFGSLSTFKYSTDEMPLMRSINIALKLVRESKWQTPINFHEKIGSLCAS